MDLFYREFGTGEPLIILHGLMGSSDNWVTLAKEYAKHNHVFIPDQRNHGQSFHSDDFNYELLTQDLAQFIEERFDGQVSLMGHSMGGKVVMHYALDHPKRIKQLIVADMAPKNYKVDYDLIFKALNAVDLNTLTSRSEAESTVGQFIQDFGMKQFLLKNLTRSENGYKWKANLKSIETHIQQMGKWASLGQKFEGPTLFVSGEKSGYVKEEDKDKIKSIFPKAKFELIHAGHWLHAEKPNEFMSATSGFLTTQ